MVGSLLSEARSNEPVERAAGPQSPSPEWPSPMSLRSDHASLISTPPPHSLILQNTHRSVPTAPPQAQRLTSHPATIHDQTFARDVIARPAREEDDRAFKVAWRTPPSGRDAFEDLLRSDRVGDQGFVHLSGSQWVQIHEVKIG